MKTRVIMLVCGILGALWAVAVVVLPGQAPQPFIPINLALLYAFLPAGLVMACMILVIALRRFLSSELADGRKPPEGSRADVDARVLSNTVEQMVLALLLWPFVITVLGAVTVIVMGVSMALSRLVFWLGYHLSPPLRLVGWSAGFYATVFATIWSGIRLLT